jgi:hypothetical protein
MMVKWAACGGMLHHHHLEAYPLQQLDGQACQREKQVKGRGRGGASAANEAELV